MHTANVKAKEHYTGFNIDDIIESLLTEECYQFHKNFQLSENYVIGICEKAKEILMRQPMLLELNGPIKICGDIYGQYADLLNLFELGGYPPTTKYLFLGNYVDRGQQGMECMTLLLAYKIKYPDKIYFLRGNHECAVANQKYGFFDECRRRTNSLIIYDTYVDIFNWLPVAAVIGKKMFCCHGGLSPDLTDLDKLRSMHRPVEVPRSGLLCDLLWSDPDKDVKGFGNNVSRGKSVVFSPEVVEKFLLKNKFDKIIRSHQVVQEGYQSIFNGRVITVFSAPNYMGQFTNNGAIVALDANLGISMQILKANAATACKNPEALSDFPK